MNIVLKCLIVILSGRPVIFCPEMFFPLKDQLESIPVSDIFHLLALRKQRTKKKRSNLLDFSTFSSHLFFLLSDLRICILDRGTAIMDSSFCLSCKIFALSEVSCLLSQEQKFPTHRLFSFGLHC